MNATGTMKETIDGTGRRNADTMSRTASSELSGLITDVEDLLKRVAHIKDIEVARVRQRVEEAVGVAKDTLRTGGKRIANTARDAAGATDQYVHSSPWQAVGVAALVGAAVALLLSRRQA